MKPEDIIVGRLYHNKLYTGVMYLGIGRRVMWKGKWANDEANFTDKQLVIVQSSHNNVGQIAQSPDDSIDGFWESFELID